jgi:hypothetical protein
MVTYVFFTLRSTRYDLLTLVFGCRGNPSVYPRIIKHAFLHRHPHKSSKGEEDKRSTVLSTPKEWGHNIIVAGNAEFSHIWQEYAVGTIITSCTLSEKSNRE